MTSWPEARRLAHAAATPLDPENIALALGAGRTLAADLVALAALPCFDTAAMDGWAVCGTGPWTLVGAVLAGDAPIRELVSGEAVEIATGAAVPRGAAGVIPYEQGPLASAAHPAGRHIRRAGEECRLGDVLIPSGARLSAAALGLAAAVGLDQITVRRAPRVSCLITGSELLSAGLPGAGRIRDAVGPLVVPLLSSFGAGPVELRHLTDDRAALLTALTHSTADLVITSGASSAGPADHLLSVLHELGAELLVEGVAVRPGHPQVLARLPGGAWLIGLPGNPLAALAGLVTLVEPLLAGLLGRLPAPLGCAVLSEPVPGQPGSHRLVPVHLQQGRARPTGHAGTAMLRGVATADAFAVVAPGAPGEVGDHVALVLLPTV